MLDGQDDRRSNVGEKVLRIKIANAIALDITRNRAFADRKPWTELVDSLILVR